MSEPSELSNRLRDEPPFAAALATLAEADRLARLSNQPPWEFALDLQALGQVGVGQSHLRWLVAEGLVEQRTETTQTRQAERTFRPARNLAFSARSCFLLTAAGLRLAGELPAALHGWLAIAQTNGAPPPNDHRPSWDAECRELWFQGQLIKRYRVPAPNQETVLAAFQAAGWPRVIDDPLLEDTDQDRKQHLSHAIRALNRRHRVCLLRFHGDGTGRRVRWAGLA